MNKREILVGYFCAEFGIGDLAYNGGLGILAGDFLKSCADLGLPVVGVGRYYSQGNFHQVLTEDGWQNEEYKSVNLNLETHPAQVTVPMRDENIGVNAKLYRVGSSVLGEENNFVPLELLYDRDNCDKLYPGSNQREKRLKQEMILGIGGVKMINALRYDNVRIYHLNEGHAALASLVADKDIIFTTHTPVPAGIDKYSKELAERVLSDGMLKKAYKISREDKTLHMMKLAMGAAVSSFGVSKLHERVAKHLFCDFPDMDKLGYVDNGVHLPTWTAPEIQKIYDRETNGEWRKDPKTLEDKLINLPDKEVLAVHRKTKFRLGELLNDGRRIRGNSVYDGEKLTIGFARRFATYKQANLIFDNIDRLRKLGKDIQLVFAGKAHPEDDGGKALIKRIFWFKEELKDEVPIWFIEDYDIEIAKHMVQGVDLWLNNPLRLEEAAGTSGMKAAANFVPQFSIIDGWWNPQDAPPGYRFFKGLVEGVTGWGIGRMPRDLDFELLEDTEKARAARARDRKIDGEDLMNKLENVIIPTFKDKNEWVKVMKRAAAYNAPWFNTHRMAVQYFEKYGLEEVLQKLGIRAAA